MNWWRYGPMMQKTLKPDAAASSRHSMNGTVPHTRKKSLFVFPGSDQQQAVAVRVWQEADTVTLAFYTPPGENAPSQKASLSFAQFKTGASFLDDVFVNNPVPEEQATEAWEKMEKPNATPLP